MMNTANKAGAKLRKYGYNGNKLPESGIYARAHDIGYDKANDYMRITYGPTWKTDKNNFEGNSYKLKVDKPKRAAKGELTEKKLYLDYKNNYTTDELKAYKRQLDNHYKQFKNSNKYGDDITARNYRAITTVLAERRRKRK